MVEFASDLGIKLLTYTPYFSQPNDQVKASKKIIIGLIKKYVGQKPRNWHKALDQIFWACRNYPMEETSYTPSRPTFGHDVVLHVDIYLQSTRIQRQFENSSNHYWFMMLYELVDLDEERLASVNILIR